MVALFVCTRHIPSYATLYRHMTVYASICRDIRVSGFQMYDICHIPVIYLVYTCHMKCHSIPGSSIYLVFTFQMKLCAPPGCSIACSSTLAAGPGIGLQLEWCLMFCRMWRRLAGPLGIRQPGPLAGSGQTRAPAAKSRRRRRWNRRHWHRRPLQQRQGRATAAADADVGGVGGALVTQAPLTPTGTAAAGRAHRRRRRRRRSKRLVDLMLSPNANDFNSLQVLHSVPADTLIN
jgi:hypothetical protein